MKGLIVVLGAQNSDKGELTEEAKKRLSEGAALLEKNTEFKIIATGGFGEHFNRTNEPHCKYAREYLRSLVRNEKLIIQEDVLSGNTIEDAFYLGKLFSDFKSDRIIVVTSDYHSDRAKLIFYQFYPQHNLEFSSVTMEYPEEKLFELQTHENNRIDAIIDDGISELSITTKRPSLKGKALVTGGNGFLGRAFVRYLLCEGYDVRTLDLSENTRKCVEGVRGSITVPEEVTNAVRGCTIVFHLAGVLGTTELISENNKAIEVNIQGTVNVLEACKVHQVKTVFFPTKPNTWLNTYSITKEAGEKFAQLYHQEFGLNVKILRWLNAYGPGQHTHPVRKAVPVMIIQALEGKDLEIWGTGEQPVDLIYTEDLARNTVYYTLHETEDAVVRDTGNSVRMTVNQLATLIIDLTGSQSKIKHLPMRPGENQNIPVELLSVDTAAKILGLSDRTTPLIIGMKHTILYYKSIGQDARLRALDYFDRFPYRANETKHSKPLSFKECVGITKFGDRVSQSPPGYDQPAMVAQDDPSSTLKAAQKTPASNMAS